MTPEEAFYFLGLKNTASLAEIRHCYKKLALKYHPDKSGSNEQFQSLKEACEIAIRVADGENFNEEKLQEMRSDWFNDLFNVGEIDKFNVAKQRLTEWRNDNPGYGAISLNKYQLLKQLIITCGEAIKKHNREISLKISNVSVVNEFNGCTGSVFMVATNDPEISLLIDPLVEHINEYSRTSDPKALRKNIEKTFKETKHDKFSPFLAAIYDALVTLVRAFIDLVDYMVSFATGSKEKRTNYYLDYSRSTRLKALEGEFTSAVNKLESLVTPEPTPDPGKNSHSC